MPAITRPHSLALALALALLMLLCTPAWAVHKCSAEGGRVVYQDAPCQDGRGAVLDVHANGPTAAQRSASGGNAPAAAEGAYDDKWHRAFAIRQFELPPLQRQLDNEVRQCDEQQRTLAARKLRANNNLAGAVWEQSISSEMQAAASACDTRQRELRTRIDALQRELEALR
ncbi:hypothetical protein [Extensimonas vulgaris]|uniref:DUF4124 domain-containing protein n=1 Tax=Extensimonas vulgaris TaxID=1031594 RepID=A0A369ATC9_9BURK|nr:hypothetical protein [Extensimonas vulgaris]RCX10724.1 hypothetical protein DFR45_102125 [Extensimonas vulgaris]TWI41366.1 hypothetical protein IP95_00123 [Extensimonas vulgaris]TXD16833.1 hypothetical protein FUT63_02245 [Extensimonas vulgaris]